MALEEMGERTEPATARKRQEAREQGMVARSADLNAALLLLAAALVVHFFGLDSLSKLGDLMVRGLDSLHAQPLDASGVLILLASALWSAALVLWPLLLALASVGVAASLLQVGFFVSGQPLAPNLGRLDPIRGLFRLLSLRGLFRGVTGFLKVLAVASVLAWSLWQDLAGPSSNAPAILISGTAGQAAAFAVGVMVSMALRALVVILILAILDYAYQRWNHEKDIRMTKAEVREEMRRMEGDPKIKDRRRKVQHQLAYQRMMRDVPKATVVVTNPTHVAVAIRYDRQSMSAPRVVAKGEEEIAHRIREVAMEHGVPIVERRELARALYQTVEVGHEIPPDFYQAVAELLAYVYRMANPGAGDEPSAAGLPAREMAGGAAAAR